MTPGFPHRKAGHCGSGALRDLLEHQGLDYGDGPLSEGAVFGLAGGLGAHFYETPELMYMVGRTWNLETDIAPNLGAGLELLDTDDPAEGWAFVEGALDAGRVPMVWADIAKLEYLRVRMTNTRHDILVVGYDDTHAWVADNDREELQYCSRESLAAARASEGFPGPVRHRVFLYDWPDALPPAEQAVAAGIRQSLANMREHGGLDAIDAFAATYREWDERPQHLPLLSVLIVKAGTGGAFFRGLFATFCTEFGVEPAAGIYTELADAWVELAGHARAGDHAAGLPLVERIRELEHAGVEALEARV